MDNQMVKSSEYNREKIIKQIEIFYETGKYEQVIEKSLELLQEDAEDLEVLYYLTSSYIFLKYFDEAEENIKHIIHEYPENTTGYLLMGQLCCETSKFDEAISYFEQCLKIDPENGYSYRGIAFAMIRSSNFHRSVRVFPKFSLKPEFVAHLQQAMNYLHLAMEYDPENSYDLILMAECYDYLRQPDKSFEYARQAILLDPASDTAHTYLAFFHLMYGDLQDARFHCEQVLMQNPNHRRALEILNEIKTYETNTEKYYQSQFKYWNSICKCHPNNTDYLRKVIELKLSFGKHQPIMELKKYMKLKQEDWEMQITYGKVLYDKKSYVRAKQHFKKLHQKYPVNPYVQDWLDTLSNVNWLKQYVLPVPRILFKTILYVIIAICVMIYLIVLGLFKLIFRKGRKS